jgi:glycosyltransferase involved in cell wall biosynthesis
VGLARRRSTDPKSDVDETARPVAIFVWGLHAGAFANLSTALAGGLLHAGAGPVHLLYLWAGPGATIEVPEGARVVRLGARRSITAPLAFVRYLRREQPRAVVTMPSIITVPALFGYRLSGRATRRRTRFVICQSDTLGNDVAIDHARVPKLRLMPFLARLCYRWADAMVVCAPGLGALLVRDHVPVPGGKVHVIGCPVDVARYRRLAEEPATHPWVKAPDTLLITTLGRLVRRKDHPRLLRALAEVRRRGVDARLVIIGSGPELETSEQTARQLGLADVVSFTGSVVNPHAEIARSDLFVMSSVDEAFCLALVEAMACGTPVISTDAAGGGPRFILEGDPESDALDAEDRAVLRTALVPLDDLALADAIESVLHLTDKGHRLASVCVRRAEAFNPDAIGAEWATFLASLGVR